MNREEIHNVVLRLLESHKGCQHSTHYLSMIGEVPVVLHGPTSMDIGQVLCKLSWADINDGMTSSNWDRLFNIVSYREETKK